MKKTFGISVLSAMLILGQPIMAYANTTDSKIVNFDDIGSIMAQQNLQVGINQNDRLDSNVGLSLLKKNIRDMKNRIDDIASERSDLSGASDTPLIIALGAEKRALLDNIKILERNLEDMPTSVTSTDFAASLSDDTQTRLAEGAFIAHNKLALAASDISIGITTIQDQLVIMQLREKLGVVSHTSVDDLQTKLTDMQTKLSSTKLQQDASTRQLKDLLNDQDDSLEIGSIPYTNDGLIGTDEDVDLKKALENSYTINLQKEKIVILTSTLARAEKDHGLSSDEYKHANYDLSNANIVLSQQKDKLNSDYASLKDDIDKKVGNLRLEEQKLEDKKVALSEAQLKMSLGLITRLDLDSAMADYQLQEDTVKTNQIDLFTAKNGFYWFLKGMPSTT